MFDFQLLLCLFFLVIISNRCVKAVTGWTYATTQPICAGTISDPCGPEYWQNVAGAEDCDDHSQSPINFSGSDITVSTDTELPVFHTTGEGCNTWFQFSNNYTFEIALVEEDHSLCGNLSLSYGGHEYSLLQAHFHSPSEHTVGGGYFSGEAHLVHANEELGKLVVIGILLQEMASDLVPSNNTFLQNIWNQGVANVLDGTPTEVKDSSTPVNPYSTLFPGSPAMYTYTGSLTTPPCSEIAQWFVFQDPVMISQKDLALLRGAFGALPTNGLSQTGNNNRPSTQPLNGRNVYLVPASAVDVDANDDDSGKSKKDDDDDDDDKYDAALGLAITGFLLALIACGLAVGLGYMLYRQQQDMLEFKSQRQQQQQSGEGDIAMSTVVSPMGSSTVASSSSSAATATAPAPAPAHAGSDEAV